MPTSLATSLVQILILCLSLTACQPDTKSTEDSADIPTAQDNTEVEKPKVDYENPSDVLYLQLMSIEPGMPISNIDMGLEKGVLSNGEGDFDVYYIKSDQNQEIGYLMPSYENENLVNDVFITSPDFILPNGLKVGSTWGEVKAKAGKVEAHGSEIEGWTYADLGQFQLKLNISITSYEVDEKEIPDATEVTEIWIKK